MDKRVGWLQRCAQLAMVASIVVVIISVSLPNTALAWMRDNISVFNLPMIWIENQHSRFNLVHLILFTVLGACVGLAQPGWRPRWVLLVVAILGIATEILQVEIPGRHPRIADAIINVVGAAIGLFVVRFIAMLCRPMPNVDSLAHNPPTRACASLLRGDGSGADVGALCQLDPSELLAIAEREGVVSLLAERLHALSRSHSELGDLDSAFAQAARRVAGRNLLCQAECRSISAALHAASIPAIWMKGAALSQWLYPRPYLRDVADIDLLLPDHVSALRAAEILAPQGYRLPNPYIAGDLVVHELLAWSERAQLELDLHWALSNDALFCKRIVWNELQTDAIQLPGLGPSAMGLSAVHAFLHACMHRALNYLTGRENRLRWIYDIHLLAGQMSTTQWDQITALATRRGLAGACHDGLLASAKTFNTPLPEATLRALVESAADEWLRCPRLHSWRYFQRATWRSLPNTPTRWRWLRQLLFPDMAHLRARYGEDGAGKSTLLIRRSMDGFKRMRRWTAR